MFVIYKRSYKTQTLTILKKVIVLSRVSTAGQDLTQQTDEVLREVYKDGYTDKNIIIIEDTESAIKLTEEERHGLNKMKDHINKNKSIECVYIYELSRLSRRQLVLFSIRDFLVERKIQLICLKPYFRLLELNGEMSQTGSLMFSLFSSLSESEMMLKQERMMRGRRRNKELGKSVGGRPPFGYDVDKDKRYIIDPVESSIIRRIFNDYGYNNKSMKEIAIELREEGYFPNITIITTITNKSTNKSSFNQGIFQPHSKKLIDKSKREGLKVYTNNRGESFISIPIILHLIYTHHSILPQKYT